MTHVANIELTIRDDLLSEVRRFVERARVCPGVRRIVLIGSLATNKEDPKDADVLVTVDDDADLTPLATAGRRLKGRAQSRNKGADIFLADPSGNYIGRICHWRECYPGIRASCDARHCGRRAYLHDDLYDIMLSASLIKHCRLNYGRKSCAVLNCPETWRRDLFSRWKYITDEGRSSAQYNSNSAWRSIENIYCNQLSEPRASYVGYVLHTRF